MYIELIIKASLYRCDLVIVPLFPQSPCCGKVYPCRLCHNEKEATHEIDRYKVSEVVCRKCHKRQPVSMCVCVSVCVFVSVCVCVYVCVLAFVCY